MDHQEDRDRLLTETAVAERLGMKRQSLQAWRQQGRGPAFIKVEGAIRYSAAALDAWLAERTVAPGRADSGEGDL